MATVLYWCAVPGCPSKYRKKSENNENFFRFPNPDCLKVLHMQKLARIRLKKWEAAIPNRRTASNRICSKHFVTGCPAALTSINDVDWVPTVNLVAAFSAKNKIPLTNEKQPLREMYVPGVQPSILQNISFQNVTIQRTPVRCAVPANDVLFHSVEKGSTVPGGLSARRINVNDTESATFLPSRSNSTYSYEPRRQERSVRSEPANIPELETTQMWSQNVERPRDMSALFHSVHKGSAVAARRIDVKNNLLPSRSKSTDPYERHERDMRLVRSEPTNISELKTTDMWNQKAERPRDANASMTAANNADIVSGK